MKHRVGNLRTVMRRLAFSVAFAAIISIGGTVFAQDKIAFGPDDSLEQIREKIKKNNYSFTVKDTWVYRLSAEEKGKMFKKRVAPPMAKRKIISNTDTLLKAVANSKAADASFDWRNYKGHSYIGAVRSQGALGACYAFGACAAAETTYNLKNGLYDANCVDFAEMYIVWTLGSSSPYNKHFNKKGNGEGSDYDYYELFGLTTKGPPGGALGFEGVCIEADFPYSISKTSPGQRVIDASKKFTRKTFNQWGRVFPTKIADTTEQIKTAISTYGTVDVAVYVDSAFQAYSSGVYEDTNTKPDSDPYYYTSSNHAVALIGWDDNPTEGGGGCWILRNSWGTTWGESGYMRIKYFSAAVNTAAAGFFESQTTGSYSISGAVAGAVQGGVALMLSGTSSAATTSATDGTFAFSGVLDGSYTVTPSLSGYTFDPPTRDVAISGGNATGCDFAATKNTGEYSISGTIRGKVLKGVAIALSGANISTTFSDTTGAYSFTGLADGSYTVTPKLSGYTFDPFSQDVKIEGANPPAVDFSAAAVSKNGQVPRLSFITSHKESVKKINDAYEQYSTDKFIIQATTQFSDAFDLNTIDENTGLTFDFGFYLFSDKLKNATTKDLADLANGGSAIFIVTGKDEIQGDTMTVEKVELRWDKNKRFTVKITGTPASNSDTNIVDFSSEDDGKVTGTIEPFELIFNDVGADFADDRSLEYTGKKETKTVIKDKGKVSEQKFTLVDWSAKGKLTDWSAKDRK